MNCFNPFMLFVGAFIAWTTSPLYLSGLSARLGKILGEIPAYWVVVSVFDVFLALLVTLLCPDVYFVSWSFPVREFLIFFALSILAVIPGLKELWRFIEPKTDEEQKAAEPFKNLGFIEASVLQIISSALPEELVFRYIFLGLLSLRDPFAGLIAVSMFFGLGHRFSHRERGLGLLISNVLSGIVFGLAYLYTGSLLVVMLIHWLGNMIPWAMMKYTRVRNVIAAATAFPLASLFVFRSEVRRILEYLAGIYTLSGLFWGLIIGLAMLGIIYAGIKILSAKNGE